MDCSLEKAVGESQKSSLSGGRDFRVTLAGAPCWRLGSLASWLSWRVPQRRPRTPLGTAMRGCGPPPGADFLKPKQLLVRLFLSLATGLLRLEQVKPKSWSLRPAQLRPFPLLHLLSDLVSSKALTIGFPASVQCYQDGHSGLCGEAGQPFQKALPLVICFCSGSPRPELSCRRD